MREHYTEFKVKTFSFIDLILLRCAYTLKIMLYILEKLGGVNMQNSILTSTGFTNKKIEGRFLELVNVPND